MQMISIYRRHLRGQEEVILTHRKRRPMILKTCLGAPGGKEMLEEHVSMNIQKLRKKANMTLQDLADRTGLTKSYLSKIERKIQTPSFSTMSRIALALGVDVTSLLTERAERLEDV